MIEGEEVVVNLQYPPPLARYEEVVANPVLFMTTVEKLHLTMGTKFKIPVLGGRELDLHRLFVEVTCRGGIEKILKERRWKEVTAVFSFPPTATNASFMLRKYYTSLLRHYEQVYYFKARDWIQSSTDALQTPYIKYSSTKKTDSEYPSPERHAIKPQSGIESSSMRLPSVGSPIAGIIDGRFDGGYLVTVTFGQEKFEGVLYEVTPRNGNDGNAPGRMKCEIRRKRDPAHPKPNISGYNFFFAEQHARLKPLDVGKDRQMSKVIGKLWSNLDESQRAVYQEKALEDKKRYKLEMEGYMERLKGGEIHTVPVSQQDTGMMEIEGDDSPLAQENDSESLGSEFDGESLDNEESLGNEESLENDESWDEGEDSEEREL